MLNRDCDQPATQPAPPTDRQAATQLSISRRDAVFANYQRYCDSIDIRPASKDEYFRLAKD
jgi:hypothetical protein